MHAGAGLTTCATTSRHQRQRREKEEVRHRLEEHLADPCAGMPVPAMPVTMVRKITGAMIIFTSLMKPSPAASSPRPAPVAVVEHGPGHDRHQHLQHRTGAGTTATAARRASVACIGRSSRGSADGSPRGAARARYRLPCPDAHACHVPVARPAGVRAGVAVASRWRSTWVTTATTSCNGDLRAGGMPAG